jgi:hypothetical protein
MSVRLGCFRLGITHPQLPRWDGHAKSAHSLTNHANCPGLSEMPVQDFLKSLSGTYRNTQTPVHWIEIVSSCASTAAGRSSAETVSAKRLNFRHVILGGFPLRGERRTRSLFRSLRSLPATTFRARLQRHWGRAVAANLSSFGISPSLICRASRQSDLRSTELVTPHNAGVGSLAANRR